MVICHPGYVMKLREMYEKQYLCLLNTFAGVLREKKIISALF